MSGSGIHKSAPCSRQTTMPAPHHSCFYRSDALPAAQLTAWKHWRQMVASWWQLMHCEKILNVKVLLESVAYTISKLGFLQMINMCWYMKTWRKDKTDKQSTSGKLSSARRFRSSIQFVNHCLRSSIFFLLNAYNGLNCRHAMQIRQDTSRKKLMQSLPLTSKKLKNYINISVYSSGTLNESNTTRSRVNYTLQQWQYLSKYQPVQWLCRPLCLNIWRECGDEPYQRSTP